MFLNLLQNAVNGIDEKPFSAVLGVPQLKVRERSAQLIGEDGSVVGYNLRQAESKKTAVEALKGLNFQTVAMGDSYNDISMLQAAETGILFRPPENVVADWPREMYSSPTSIRVSRMARILGFLLASARR